MTIYSIKRASDTQSLTEHNDIANKFQYIKQISLSLEFLIVKA